MRRAAENVRVDPMQHGPDESTRGHQNNYVRHARITHQVVGDEGENEQLAEKSKK